MMINPRRYQQFHSIVNASNEQFCDAKVNEKTTYNYELMKSSNRSIKEMMVKVMWDSEFDKIWTQDIIEI